MSDPFKSPGYPFSAQPQPQPPSVSTPIRSVHFSDPPATFSIISSDRLSTSSSGNFRQFDAARSPIDSESKRQLIKQLKENVELCYRGVRMFSWFACYPLKVLRWQCQMHSESVRHHLTPVTLLPVIYNLNCSGFLGLWKGCFSMAAYHGSKIVIESVLTAATPFDANIEDVKRLQKLNGYLALKFLTCAITTPIYAVAVYESVQSVIAHESLGLVDLLKEAWNRVTGYRYNYRTRLIPFWSLILPTSLYFVGTEVLAFALEKIVYKSISSVDEFLKKNKRPFPKDEDEEEVITQPFTAAVARLSGQIGAIIALYPIETVMNRLIVQGTRTIIDNTDSGCGVVPINTRYESFLDCAYSINSTEGFFGFYKGLGAVIIDATMCYAALKLVQAMTSHYFDSEWTSQDDMNQMRNLMTSSPR